MSYGRTGRTSNGALLSGAVTALALALLVGAPFSAGGAAGDPGPRVPAAGATNDTPFIQHVVVLVLENEVRSEVWAHGPYERYLARSYGNATNMFAECHPSAPNYLAMVAAVVNQCGSDTWTNYTNATLFDSFDDAGYSWASYAENLPAGACANPAGATSGEFATRHLPALFFASVLANRSYCQHHVLGADAFNDSVAAGSLGNFSFYTPNLCDDGHDGCGGNSTSGQRVAQADAWLKGWLAPILNHTGAYAGSEERELLAHTAFYVTWDEGTGSNSGFALSGLTGGDNFLWCLQNALRGDAVCGGPVYSVVVSPYSVHRTFALNDSAYGWVRTVEWLFHLAPLGNPAGLDNRTGLPSLKPLFNFTANS